MLGPGSFHGSSEVEEASPESQAESQLQAEVIKGLVGQAGALPSTQDVLKRAAFKYMRTIDSSKEEDLYGFLQYIQEMHILLTETASSGEFPSFLN